MYHYLGCGLPDVWLANGYRVVETEFGTGVTIHALEELHDAIGEAIVTSNQPLTFDEFRFLRKELELSQEGLAQVLGCDKQSVARWEKGKGKRIDPASERLLRVLYQGTKLGKQQLKPMMQRLQALECEPSATKKIVVRERHQNWHGKIEAAV